MLSGEVAKRLRSRRSAGRHDQRFRLQRHRRARASVRSSPRASRSTSWAKANDYVGKGLSGGRHCGQAAGRIRHRCLRKASSSATRCSTAPSPGECYFRGVAGERFAVRNSGAIAVVEGTGDHGCEYMTGGVVVVIGQPRAATSRPACPAASPMCSTRKGTSRAAANLSMVDLEPVDGGRRKPRAAPRIRAAIWKATASWTYASDMTRYDAERLLPADREPRQIHRIQPELRQIHF